nr:immunoglobulin heavy chain junction region [Mus musculus]
CARGYGNLAWFAYW